MAAIVNASDLDLQATSPRMVEVTAGVPKWATVQLFKRTAAAVAPDLPSADISYDFAACLASGLTNGWTQTLPVIGGPYRWMTSATASGTPAIDVIASTEWSAPALISEDGEDGVDGVRGTVNIAAAIVGSSWSNLEALLALGAAGHGTPISRDVVTLYNVSAHYAETRYYDAGTASWIALGAYVNGNLLVDGTVLAQALDVDELSAIVANLGTVIAGILRNSTDSMRMDLNATGSGLVLRAGAYSDFGSLAGWHYPVEIRADGSGFFGRGIVAGGTVKASGTYSIPDADRPAVQFYASPPPYYETGGGGA